MELNPFEHIECLPLPNKKVEGKGFYFELISSITTKVKWIVKAGFEEASGDFFALGTDQDGAIYFIVSGYGSCEGCDRLFSCETDDDLLELRDDLKRRIRKFDSLSEFESWFNTAAQTEWYEYEDVVDFIKKVKKRFSLSLQWRGETF